MADARPCSWCLRPLAQTGVCENEHCPAMRALVVCEWSGLAIGANGQCGNRLPGTGEDPCPVARRATTPDALDPTYLDTIATLRQHLASSRARVDELQAEVRRLEALLDAVPQP